MKEEALDRTVRRTRFARCCGPAARQTMEKCSCVCCFNDAFNISGYIASTACLFLCGFPALNFILVTCMEIIVFIINCHVDNKYCDSCSTLLFECCVLSGRVLCVGLITRPG